MARPFLMHLAPSREALFGFLFRHQPTEGEKDRAQDVRTRDAVAQARAKAHVDLGVRAAELKAARDEDESRARLYENSSFAEKHNERETT